MLDPANEELQELIDKVLEQIVEDVEDRDLTVIENLLTFVPEENLRGFLREEDI